MSHANFAPERVRANFRIDLASGAFGAAMFGFVVPFTPVLVRRLGGSELEVALAVAAPFIGHLISPVFCYLLSGLPLVGTVGATSMLARLAFLVGVLLTTSPLLLAMSYVVFWVITLSNIAAYTGVMQGIYPDEQRATAMGRVRIGASLAGIVAAIGGGALLQLSDEPLRVLALAAAVSLGGAAGFLLIRHRESTPRPRIASPLRLLPTTLRDPRFRRYLSGTLVFGFGNLMGIAIYPLLLVDRFDAPNAFVGVYTAVSAAATMVGYHFWGRRIDRGSSLTLTVANAALTVGMPLGYLLAPSAVFLLPAAVVAGFTLAGFDLTFFTNAVQLGRDGRAGDYMSAQSFAVGVRGSVAPFVASALLVATDARAVLVLVIALQLAGVLLLRALARELAVSGETEGALEVAG